MLSERPAQKDCRHLGECDARREHPRCPLGPNGDLGSSRLEEQLDGNITPRELTPVFFCIATRRPTDNDPGQVAEGRYVLSADLVVTLTDQDGKPIENIESATVTDPKYATATAARLLRDHRAGTIDFNRPLHYRRLGDLLEAQ